ncbi:hypothetical protein AKJ16_DCAP19767 [Drosera capensis]
MPSRSSAQDSKHWRGDSRRKNSSCYQRRPREEVNMERRERLPRPQFRLSSNVLIRREAEQQQSPSICLQIFHEGPSRAYERPIRDVSTEEAGIESPSFEQWISPPYQGGGSEGWRDYSNNRTESWNSKGTCGLYSRGRRNYERYYPRQEKYHDEFSSPEHNDYSREDPSYVPEPLADMRVKQGPGAMDPPLSHEDISFQAPRFRAEKWPDSNDAGRSTSGVGCISRTTWLRDASFSTKGLVDHAGVNGLTSSEDISFSVQPGLQNREAKSVSSSLVPGAARNDYHKSEAEDQRGQRERHRGSSSGRTESWSSKQNLKNGPSRQLFSLRNHDDGIHVRAPEHHPEVLVKPESGFTYSPRFCAKKGVAPSSAVENMTSDIHSIFRTLVTSRPVADSGTWLSGCSAKALQDHSGSPKPVPDAKHGVGQTMSQSFAPATTGSFLKNEPEVDGFTISRRADDAAQQLGDKAKSDNSPGSLMEDWILNNVDDRLIITVESWRTRQLNTKFR